MPNKFQFRLGTRLELEIPRNPTVVLFLKIPRVLCSHPLTGGPGFLYPLVPQRGQASNSKHQTPNTREAPNLKIQTIVVRGHWTGTLEFGAWDSSGVWGLGFDV